MKRSGKVKLKDIAEASGVAVTTVSAALNHTGRISEELRNKILKVSRQMNYEPNIAAKLLKQKNCADIGLIISDIPERIAGSGYFQPMISHFIRYCDSEEIRCQIEYHNPEEKSGKLPALLTGGLAGGVLHGGKITDEIRSWLDKHPSFPFIALEEDYKYSIHSPYDTAAYEVMQYFAALGHRKVGLIVGPQVYAMQSKPKEGVLKAVHDFGLDINDGKWIFESDMTLDMDTVKNAVSIGVELFNQEVYPTAILCCDARVAKGIIYAALKCGLDIPGDVSIFGSSSKSESEQMYPPLSSISWNATEAIEKGCNMLHSLMKKKVPIKKNVLIKPIISIRESVAKYKN